MLQCVLRAGHKCLPGCQELLDRPHFLQWAVKASDIIGTFPGRRKLLSKDSVTVNGKQLWLCIAYQSDTASMPGSK